MPSSEQPLVSVVIPSYNYGRFITEAVDSVLGQTYAQREVIVVDDGSNDDTAERLLPYRDRIQYVRQENQGPSAARNTGIRLARGEWVGVLDADDLWHRQKLEVQVRAITSHPELGMLGTWVTFEAADLLTVLPENPALDFLTVQDLLTGTPIGQSSLLFRRSCFEAVGLFDVRIRYVEDRDLWLRFAARFPSARLDVATFFYRRHAENCSLNAQRMYDSFVLVLGKFFEEHPEHEHLRATATAFVHWDASRAFLAQNDFGNARACLLRSLMSSPLRLPNVAPELSWARAKLFARLFMGEHLFKSYHALSSMRVELGQWLRAGAEHAPTNPASDA